MTRDEIIEKWESQDRRARDAWVAERVMGLHVYTMKEPDRWKMALAKACGVGKRERNKIPWIETLYAGSEHLCFYSTNKEDAWTILDFLHKQGWLWQMTQFENRVVVRLSHPAQDKLIDDVEASDQPQAICLAALIAVETE